MLLFLYLMSRFFMFRYLIFFIICVMMKCLCDVDCDIVQFCNFGYFVYLQVFIFFIDVERRVMMDFCLIGGLNCFKFMNDFIAGKYGLKLFGNFCFIIIYQVLNLYFYVFWEKGVRGYFFNLFFFVSNLFFVIYLSNIRQIYFVQIC